VEIGKRDGRREAYDSAKLARSLARAGVVPHMLSAILDRVGPGPHLDTAVLRARVESVLSLKQPNAARRYASTCSLTARGAEQAGYGWVCMNPETVSRLGLRSGDTVWLSHDEATAPFSIEPIADVERGQVWLNIREMAAMGVSAGTRVAASRICRVTWPLSEESADLVHAYATSAGPGRNGGR